MTKSKTKTKANIEAKIKAKPWQSKANSMTKSKAKNKTMSKAQCMAQQRSLKFIFMSLFEPRLIFLALWWTWTERMQNNLEIADRYADISLFKWHNTLEYVFISRSVFEWQACDPFNLLCCCWFYLCNHNVFVFWVTRFAYTKGWQTFWTLLMGLRRGFRDPAITV